MPTVTHTERETLAAADSLGPVNLVLPTLRDTFTKTARLFGPVVGVTEREAFLAGDATTERPYVRVREQFLADDRATPTSHLQHVVLEQFLARGGSSQAGVFERRTERESFLANDAVTVQETFGAVVREQFFAHDRTSLAGLYTQQVLEQFVARSRAWARQSVLEREVFVATGRASAETPHRYVARETFSAGDRTWVRYTGYTVVRERFTVDDRALPAAHHYDLLREEFSISSREFIPYSPAAQGLTFEGDVPMAATDAYTADLMTWGMSRHVDLGVTEHDGVQFGVGPNGVFRALDAPVLSFIEVPDTKLDIKGEPLHVKKRINYLYTYSEHAQPLDVLVTADHRGARLTTAYVQEDRDSTDTRAVRCQIGRGYTSNYIRLRVGGVRVFDIAATEVEITPTRRRI